LKLGLSIPQVGVNGTRENALKLAQAAEKENFESLWVQERILWPINPKSKYPASPDGSLRKEYQHNLDSMNLLSYIAANTSKILLGTGIAVSAYHLPVQFAKEVATVDILSQGRFVCGVGLGWSKDEYQTSNVPFERRGERQDEFIQAIKKVWTDDIVEFDGEFYNISPSKIDPKPVQKPHPKILLAGFGPKTFERIANYADGYLSALAMPIPIFEQLVSGFKQTIEKAGKNPDDFNISTLTFPQISETSSGNGDRFPMTGTIEEVGGDIKKLKEMGVNRAILVEFAGDGYDVDKSIQVAKELKKFAD
jgi:probable F420-dependent oxidoreductase